MEFIIGLILGVISSFILATYEKNKFIYEKKLEKYSKFIELYQNAVAATLNHDTPEKERQDVVFAKRQLSLVATSEIDILISGLFESSTLDQSKLLEEIIICMKKDLDNYKNVFNCPFKFSRNKLKQ
ncbi:TPA: hypothetical protein JAN54_05280 [Legionella pneumophila]|nr:hypothetical protein [Legionella pneumophila]HDV6633760.1 hypothetical protein [Legionella pneumophila]